MQADVPLASETPSCDSCGSKAPKYTCPACETRSCSLACVKNHKTNKQCTGQIDPVRHLGRDELLTATSLDRDYNFLQGLGRSIQLESHSRQNYTRNHRDAVGKREFMRSGVRIRPMPRAMTRAQKNKSHWDKNNRVYVWTVEIIDGDKSIIQNVPETKPVREFGTEAQWAYVRDADNQLKLLKQDLNFGDALRGLTIVEFPVLVLKEKDPQAEEHTSPAPAPNAPALNNDSDNSDSDAPLEESSLPATAPEPQASTKKSEDTAPAPAPNKESDNLDSHAPLEESSLPAITPEPQASTKNSEDTAAQSNVESTNDKDPVQNTHGDEIRALQPDSTNLNVQT